VVPDLYGFLCVVCAWPPPRLAFKAVLGTCYSSCGALCLRQRETGNAAIESGLADLVASGRLNLANPDLPERFRLKRPSTPTTGTPSTLQQVKGYIDYPFLNEAVPASS